MTNFYAICKRFSATLWTLLLPIFLLAQIQVTTSNPKGLYEAGQQMNFQARAISNGTLNYKIYFDRYTDPAAQGSISVYAGQTVNIPFSLATPGVVFCEVEQNYQKATTVAAFSPFEIQQVEAEPSDFDAFWNEKKSQLAAVPMNPSLQVIEETQYATSYQISLAQIDNRRVYGYLHVPKGTGPFPAVLEFPAFGDAAFNADDYVAERAGALHMKISIHNAPANQVDPNAYAPDNITNEDENYFRWAILAGVRAAEYLKSRSDWDNEHFALSGVSQGGALATMIAGLDEDVTQISIAHPAFAEHAGNAYGIGSGWPRYLRQAVERGLDYQATLQATRYYDIINFAKRYDGKVQAFVSYKDDITLASGIFAAFNQFEGEKTIMHFLTNGHNPTPSEYWNGRFDFWRRYIPSTQTPPWPWPESTTGFGIDAGNDIQTDANSVNLTASIEFNMQRNPDYALQWSVLEGPGNVSFSNAQSYSTGATFSQEGNYILQLQATVDENFSATNKYFTLIDNVKVTVGNQDNQNTSINITCPDNKYYVIPSGANSTIVSWQNPTVSTDCSGGIRSLEKISGISNYSTQGVGTYTVQYEALNACGDRETCSFNIVITAEPNDDDDDTTNPPVGEYCDAAGNAPWQYWIDNVKIGDIDNASFKENYGDFTALETEIAKNQSTEIQLTTGYSWASSNSYWKVWIDFNQNNVFENNENIVSTIQTGPANGTSSASITPTFTIPASAQEGLTRMRVAMSVDEYPTACGNFNRGEVEDYSVNIIAPTVVVPILTVNCPNDVTIPANPGQTGIVANYTIPSATTTCSSPSITRQLLSGPVSGTYLNEGTYEVRYLIKDACGNDEICTFLINITANEDDGPNEEYCASRGIIPWNDYIRHVQISSINNYSNKEGYADFTNKLGYVTAGDDKYITVEPGSDFRESFWTIFIDFNQDNDFDDAGEEVIRLRGMGLQGGSFDIPSSAYSGITRMRVVLRKDGFGGPCGNFGRGEVEDYSLQINSSFSRTSQFDDFVELQVEMEQVGTALLNYTTNIQQSDASFYIIEKKLENGEYVLLDKKRIDSNSEGYQINSYRDPAPEIGENTYRVGVLYENGATLYSPDRSISNNYKGMVFPNPTADGVYVNLGKSNAKRTRIKVMDVQGKIVDLIEVEAEEGLRFVDLSFLNSGIYFIKVETRTKHITERVVLNKEY